VIFLDFPSPVIPIATLTRALKIKIKKSVRRKINIVGLDLFLLYFSAI